MPLGSSPSLPWRTVTAHADAGESTLSPVPPRAGDAEPAYYPMRLGSLFDASFALYKSHFSTLFFLAALLYLPLQIVLIALMTTWLRPLLQHLNSQSGQADIYGSFTAAIGMLFIGAPQVGLPGLCTLIALVLISGPITIVTADIYLGRPVSLRSSLRLLRASLLRLITGWGMTILALTGVFLAVLMITFVLAIILAAVLATHVPEAVITLIVLAGLFSPYFVVTAVFAKWFCLTTPLILLEGQSLLAAPDRNSALTGGKRFARTWGACTLLPLVTLGLQFLILGSLSSALSSLPLSPMLRFLVEAAAIAGISLFFQPFWMIFLTLTYFDLRIRAEGLDLLLLAARLPQSQTSARTSSPIVTAAPAHAPPVPPLPPLPTAPRSARGETQI